MLPCYQLHTRFIPARYQAALLLEYADAQDLSSQQVLAGSGLHEAALLSPDARLSPAEYLHLLHRINQLLPGAETALQLGQQLLPGQLGPISHALLQAPSLGHALDLLLRQQTWLSPLLAPHLMQLGDQTLLYWTDACISPRLRGFVVDMMMAAVTGMSRWLSGERLPWRYRFNRTRPASLEQYTVHLGSALQFDDCLNAMSIPTTWLAQAWPRGSQARMQLALDEASLLTAGGPRESLLAALYAHLSRQLRNTPCLEQASAAFATSPATFKRHLALHGTHFQAELDQVRTHVTLQLIHNQGYSNEQIAAWLGFHDATNFRRSFKRWTGLTPSVLRSRLLPGI
ncbi:AraC family transcriptional regulator [Uliginosibacterium flavum]|uniref:AraC family transcriptional regulator ligand-binding domain-containing protein n=1 Tax=Uliginosibacterium flavum TaxID=1396831 RepID=A0ABV2TLQ9_9RHOO